MDPSDHAVKGGLQRRRPHPSIWCLLFVLIRQGLKGGIYYPKMIMLSEDTMIGTFIGAYFLYIYILFIGIKYAVSKCNARLR